MTIFNCNICNYTTSKSSNYTKHIKTKKHLSNVNSHSIDNHMSASYEYLQIPANTCKYLQTTECNLNSNNLIDTSTICSYCNTSFNSNKNMFNHYIKACIHIPDKIKNRLIIKHNSNPRTKTKLPLVETIIKENKIITNNPNNSNNTNNIIGNT